MSNFEKLGLSPEILDAVRALGFESSFRSKRQLFRFCGKGAMSLAKHIPELERPLPSVSRCWRSLTKGT